MSTSEKKRILMLVSHHPALDPRLDWEASRAARTWDVSLCGLNWPRRDGYEKYAERKYKIYTGELEWSRAGLTEFFVGLCRCWPYLAPAFLVGFVAALALCGLAGILTACAGRKISFGKRLHGSIRFPLTAVSLLREIALLPARPELVHCNDLDTLLVGVILKRKWGVPLVYDAHEFYPFDNFSRPVIFALRTYEAALIRHVDAAFTVNHLLAARMEEEYGVRVRSLPNCGPLEEDGPERPPARDGAALPLRFFFMGGFGASRGLEDWIGAWRRVDPARAILQLQGNAGPARDACMALAEQYGLLNRSVFFPPAVAESELVASARQADVGVIPYLPVSVNNTFCCPNKLAQYMQAGLAVVSNDLPFVKEILETSGAGVAYRWRDEDSLLAAVERFAADPEFLQQCRRKALEFVTTTYNWDEQSRGLYAAYAELTGVPESRV